MKPVIIVDRTIRYQMTGDATVVAVVNYKTCQTVNRFSNEQMAN